MYKLYIYYIYIYIHFKKNNETGHIVTGFVVFLKEFIALYYWYIELFTRKILNIHAWIPSCHDGITPNSGLTGLKIILKEIYIYIHIYIYIYIYTYLVYNNLTHLKTLTIWSFVIYQFMTLFQNYWSGAELRDNSYYNWCLCIWYYNIITSHQWCRRKQSAG